MNSRKVFSTEGYAEKGLVVLPGRDFWVALPVHRGISTYSVALTYIAYNRSGRPTGSVSQSFPVDYQRVEIPMGINPRRCMGRRGRTLSLANAQGGNMWCKLMLCIIASCTLLACQPQAHVAIKNDCPGAWFRVSWLEGLGRTQVFSRLEPGERVVIPLTGVANQSNRFVIMVDGFRMDDDTPLGSATRDLWVSPSYDGSSPPRRTTTAGKCLSCIQASCPDLYH